MPTSTRNGAQRFATVRIQRVLLLGTTVVAAWTNALPAQAQACTTTVASYDEFGVQAAWPSKTGYRNCLSSGGRLLAFSSQWSLVAADGDTTLDVYLRDRVAHTIELVSVSSGGSKGNAASGGPDVSPDGRFVCFSSDATNLVANDTNWLSDVFLRDRFAQQTSRVSVGKNGQQGNHNSFGASMSADGRFVAFWSFATNLTPGDTNGTSDIFLYDHAAGTSICVSASIHGGTGNGISGSPVTSGDGRYVAFGSGASDLVAGDTNGFGDAFVYDTLTGLMSIVSVDSLAAR